MSTNSHELMIELLSRIRRSTLDTSRKDLAEFFAKNQKNPDPWMALRGVLTEENQSEAEKPEVIGNPTVSLLKTAGFRLLDSLSFASQQKNKNALHHSLEKRVEESRIACMLFTMDTGNMGMPWVGADISLASEVGSIMVRFGSVSIVADDLKEAIPELDWNLPVPAIIPLDKLSALFVVGTNDLRKTAIDSLHSVALRLLLTIPPGMIRVSVIDPMGYSLAQPPWSYWPEVVLVGSQVIEERVTQVFAQMERIGTEILQGHKSLKAFNEWAVAHGEAAIPYHVLIVHDCPSNLSPRILHKLQGLIQNGGRCGIFTLIQWDEKKDGYGRSKFDAMAGDGMVVEPDSFGQFHWRGELFADCRVELDVLPAVEVMERIVLPVAQAFQARAEETVGFDQLLHSWEGGGESSVNGIRTPLGISETGKMVSLEIGEGNSTHGLIIGGTGSGKSSLMHVIITGLVETYPPEELQLYLIDLKGGVEFKQYALNRLPHAAVVAIDCEREFALSALDALCREMRRRMNLYRASTASVTSIAMYRNIGGQLPRILLVMDEFQKLLSENDDLADKARSKLESLLKEGRGFGIHLLLGTQSLKGILMRGGSLEQIAMRIVLQCSPEESREVLANDNLAGSVLPKYHGIYNDHQGRKDANVQFKAAYLTREENGQRLAALSARYEDKKWQAVVFEGNEKTAISECPGYSEVLASREYLVPGKASRIWLGEPISIEPPVEFLLDPGRGRNFLALMQDSEDGSGVLYNALLSLLAQNNPDYCSFTILNLLTAKHEALEWPQKICALFKHSINVVSHAGVGASLSGLMDDLNSRIQAQGDHVPCFVFVIGLQYARDLRVKESYGEPALTTQAGILRFLLKEGPENGMHVLVWCDMLSNLARCGRGLLDEFGVCMAGKMEQSDSNSIFGSPVAARLHSENRAVMTDDTFPGVIRSFRPYIKPEFSFFETLSIKQ